MTRDSRNTIPRPWLVVSGILGLAIIVAILIYLELEPFDSKIISPDEFASADADFTMALKNKLIEQISHYQPPTTFTEDTARGAPISNSFNSPPNQPQQHQHLRVLNSNYTVVTATEGMQRLANQENLSIPTKEAETVSWLLSPTAIDDIIIQAEQAQRDWTYGWIQLSEPVPEPRLNQQLSAFDVSVLGASGSMVRVKLPRQRELLEQLREFSQIQGFGVQPIDTKIAPGFEQQLQSATATELQPLFITVLATTTTDEYRRVLQNLGVQVGHFDPDIRAFDAVAPSSLIARISKLDFVQSVDPIGIATSNHDTAVQSMGVDAIRKIGDTFGQYTGITGSSIPIAVADTGLNTNHVSISSFRASICGENFVPGEDQDLWIDEGGHGSHVTGTVAGVGYFQPRYAGMAPGVQDIRFAKVLSGSGGGAFSWIHRGLDFLTEQSSCPSEGWSSTKHQPRIINLSLAATSLLWDSTSSTARKLDSIVWTHRQLYIVSASNSNIGGYSNYAAAKNSLAVGASYDNGDIARFSSHGPTIDGRLLPNITGTGVNVRSVRGGGSYDAYRSLSGTSMSSPAVAGVAALIMEASPVHQQHPALARARLMASAIKPDSWLDSDRHFPADNTNGPGSYHAAYGLGFVSARASILNLDDPNGWTSSGVTAEVNHKEVVYHDIEVPDSASRLDVVLTWDEPNSDTIANQVLNDLDLFLDHEADCGTGACGDYSSVSSVDNVEWIIIKDPDPGTYRIKVSGSRVFTNLRAGVAWTIIRGASAPQLSISANQESFVSSGSLHDHTVKLTVESSSYIASGTTLYVDCRTHDNNPCSSFGSNISNRKYDGNISREDGMTIEQKQVGEFLLGEVAYGEKQELTLQLFSDLTEDLNIHFTTSAFNAASSSTSVQFLVEDSDGSDLTNPEPPSNDTSTAPIVLVDSEGSIEVDPLIASTESGESGLFLGDSRSLRSLWYEWQSDSQELASFIVSPQENISRWFARDYPPSVDVFEVVSDELGMTSLDLVTSSQWSAQWFPKTDQTYRLRVSGSHASFSSNLSWFVGARPENDDFANATVLSGEEGTISGHNLGATIEAGEQYGERAASIWYQWEAPSDGTYGFLIRDAQVVQLFVFVGNSVDDLRLISGIWDWGDSGPIEAKAGALYYLMVSSPNATSGGWKFDELTWSRSSPESQLQGDLFSDAWDAGSASLGEFSAAGHRPWFSVEPDEPVLSGIQTSWLRWTAPETGLYTWYWNESYRQVNLWQGDSLDSLVISVSGDEAYSHQELLVDAERDQEYYLSVGYEPHDSEAFDQGYRPGYVLRWGLTPENNTMNNASVITGTEGSTEGTTQFATTAPLGLDKYGFSSLWYSYTAEESGWYKFRLSSADENSYTLAALQQSDGQALTVLNSSITSVLLEQGVEVIVYIEAGESVLLRVGNKYRHNATSFILHWESTETPQWLKYLGKKLVYKPNSTAVSTINQPNDLTFDEFGYHMFVSTDTGVLVFERDVATGSLTFVHEVNQVPPDAKLIWDGHRSLLYANVLHDWWAFKPKAQSESMELELEYTFRDDDHGLFSSGASMFMDPDGNYLYRRQAADHIVSFGFDENGKLESLPFREKHSFIQISPHMNGSHWFYPFTKSGAPSAGIARRDIGLSTIRHVSNLAEHHHDRWNTEVPTDIDDGYVFTSNTNAWSQLGITLFHLNFELSEITTEVQETYDNTYLYCVGFLWRPEVSAVDLICDWGVMVIEYDPDSNELVIQDFVRSSIKGEPIPDRFDRYIPQYLVANPSSFAVSPDHKHVYVATQDEGILIFERIGVEPVNLENLPPLVKRLDLLSVADNEVQFGSETVHDGCMEITDMTVDEVTYTVLDSKWQQRDVGAAWTDVADSEESEQICSLKLEKTKEYRLVATISVDGESAEYASNFIGKVFYTRLDELEVTNGEVELDTVSTDSCMKVSDITINDINYSVEISQWQHRDSAGVDWIDIESTMKTRELCVHEQTSPGEYRLVGTFLIDGVRGYYHSNTVNIDED